MADSEILIESVVPSSATAAETIKYIWSKVNLPESDLEALRLVNSGTDAGTSSTFKIGQLAQATVALATLAAASIQAARLDSPIATVTVDQKHALVEFKSERFTIVNGKLPPSPWGPIGGLHQSADGWVRVHDSFPHHAKGAVDLLGADFTRESVADKLKTWKKLEFEDAAVRRGICCVALRTEEEWDAHPQSSAIPTFPVMVEHQRNVTLQETQSVPFEHWSRVPRSICQRKPLAGVRVLEFSRVIAAPLAGKTLALHGADVLWVTAPHLPDLPSLDQEFSRGKRSIQLDIRQDNDLRKFKDLVAKADVFLQSYRPGSLAKRGLSYEDLIAINPSLVYSTLSAYGPAGPWKNRRGFDSLVQTVSGMNATEAAAEGAGKPARVTPCQALDHAGGYLLAFGTMAALRRRMDQPGAYRVETSLAQAMKLLKGLGRLPASTLKEWDPVAPEEVEEYMQEHDSELGHMRFIKHSGIIQGADGQWAKFPRPLGSDQPEWEEVL